MLGHNGKKEIEMQMFKLVLQAFKIAYKSRPKVKSSQFCLPFLKLEREAEQERGEERREEFC